MRKSQFASKKSRSYTGWWKHARPVGKRTKVKWGQLYFSKQKSWTLRRTQGKELIDPEKKSKISNGARKPRKNP